MALADEVTSRYPASKLRQLTNPNSQSASTVDGTILGLAVDDVEADFKIYCATTYDGTDARHVSVAVEGVISKLSLRMEAAGEGAAARHDAYLDRIRALARVTGRDRVIPRSKSILTPSSEREEGTETVRPDTDRSHFEDLIPDPAD